MREHSCRGLALPLDQRVRVGLSLTGALLRGRHSPACVRPAAKGSSKAWGPRPPVRGPPTSAAHRDRRGAGARAPAGHAPADNRCLPAIPTGAARLGGPHYGHDYIFSIC